MLRISSSNLVMANAVALIVNLYKGGRIFNKQPYNMVVCTVN